MNGLLDYGVVDYKLLLTTQRPLNTAFLFTVLVFFSEIQFIYCRETGNGCIFSWILCVTNLWKQISQSLRHKPLNSIRCTKQDIEVSG